MRAPPATPGCCRRPVSPPPCAWHCTVRRVRRSATRCRPPPPIPAPRRRRIRPRACRKWSSQRLRRSQTLEAVPYSISVVSAQQIAASGATDIASLATQVPGLSACTITARALPAPSRPSFAASTPPAVPARGFRTFEQDPVGTYIGNSPIDGYFQLDDLNRVEVLRGPQGTLYGAGALGGALRIIPNSPQLDTWAGSVEAGGSRLAHSDGTGYTIKGMLNVPLGDVLAFRASAQVRLRAGLDRRLRPEERTNNGLYGVPLLANPVRSGEQLAHLYQSRRLELSAAPSAGGLASCGSRIEAFSVEVAQLNAHVTGDGGPQVNPDFAGGVSPFDPHAVFPAGGQYQEFALIDEPFDAYHQPDESRCELRRGICHRVRDDLVPVDLGLSHPGLELRLRRFRRRLLPAVLRGRSHQPALHLSVPVHRRGAHLLAGSAAGVEGRPLEPVRLRARRLLSEPDSPRRLVRHQPGIARALGGAGLHRLLLRGRHLPQLPAAQRSRRPHLPAARHPELRG